MANNHGFNLKLSVFFFLILLLTSDYFIMQLTRILMEYNDCNLSTAVTFTFEKLNGYKWKTRRDRRSRSRDLPNRLVLISVKPHFRHFRYRFFTFLFRYRFT